MRLTVRNQILGVLVLFPLLASWASLACGAAKSEQWIVGIHTITLYPGVETSGFEKFMTEELFPAFGGVNRRNIGVTRQYLVKETNSGENQDYLGVVECMSCGGIDEDALSQHAERHAKMREK